MRQPDARQAETYGRAAETDAVPVRVESGGLKSVDRFSILGKIDKGGFSTVYKAYDPDRERNVAIKILEPGTIALETFDVERRVLRLLTDERKSTEPIVPALLETGEHEGKPYNVMTLCDASERDISEHMPLGEARHNYACSAMSDITSLVYTLQLVHRLVHGDLKPGNVLLQSVALGCDKTEIAIRRVLTDMAFAFPVDQRRKNPEGPDGRILALCTPLYSAPEQMQAHTESGHEADVYMLGASAFDLFTGVAPHSGMPSAAVLMDRKVHNAELSEADVRLMKDSGVPNDVASVIQRMMRHEPDSRISLRNARNFFLNKHLSVNRWAIPPYKRPYVFNAKDYLRNVAPYERHIRVPQIKVDSNIAGELRERFAVRTERTYSFPHHGESDKMASTCVAPAAED